MDTKDCNRIHKAFKAHLALLKRLAPMNDTLSELLTYVVASFPYDHTLDHLPELAQNFAFWTRVETLANLMESELYNALCGLVNQGDEWIKQMPNRQALRVSAEVVKLVHAARAEPKRWKKIELLAHAEWMLEAGFAFLQAHVQVEAAKALYKPYLSAGQAQMRANRQMQTMMGILQTAGEFGWNSIALSVKAYFMACDHQTVRSPKKVVVPMLGLQPA